MVLPKDDLFREKTVVSFVSRKDNVSSRSLQIVSVLLL